MSDIDYWNTFKMANRKVSKNVTPYVLGGAGTIMPLIVGQPELIPAGLAVAGVLNEANTNLVLPAYGKNKKRIEKLEEAKKPPNNISSNNNMPYRRTYARTTGGGLHAPRSRGTGYDTLSYMSKASLGHAQANSMLGKLESHMAQARQHNQGLVGVSGNLINQMPALQSAPQQNFQFRHTLITPTYHPTVFGND